MKLVAPDYSEIIGTWDVIPAVALFHNTGIKKPRGKSRKYKFDYADQADIQWDEQKPKTEDGQRLFVCCHGKIWKESELLLVKE